jgi:hypothetical protein
MLSSGIMLGVWGIITWWKTGAFTKAVETIFDADPHADISVGWLQMVFFAGGLLSIVIACFLLGLTAAIHRPQNSARILTWLVCLAAIPFLWLTYLDNGKSYINAIGTGPDDATARLEMSKVDALTPWRFSGWYHGITIGFGSAVAIFLICAAILLAIPPSGKYFTGVPAGWRKRRPRR